MIEKLPRRERQLLDALLSLGLATAEEIRAVLKDPPSNSAVRAMLSRLEAKRLVSHRMEGQRYVYSAAKVSRAVRDNALKHLVQTFFGGSPASAATALLGMAKRIDEDEMRRLEELLELAREEQQ
jgi:predicted transcriptional regulator